MLNEGGDIKMEYLLIFVLNGSFQYMTFDTWDKCLKSSKTLQTVSMCIEVPKNGLIGKNYPYLLK